MTKLAATLRTDLLQAAVQTVQCLLASKTPHADHILLKFEENLVVQATNGSLVFSLLVPGTISGEGAILVDGYKFSAMLSTARDEITELRMTKRLVVESGPTKAQLSIRDIADTTYPVYQPSEDGPNTISFEMEGEELKRTIRDATWGAAGDEVDHLPLDNVCLSFARGLAVSTDKHKAVAVPLPEIDGGGDVLISARELNNLIRGIKDEAYRVRITPGRFELQSFSRRLAAARSTEMFPDPIFALMGVQPMDSRFKTTITFNAEELKDLAHAGTIFGRKGTQTIVVLEASDGGVTGHVASPEDRMDSDMLQSYFTGDDVMVGVDATALKALVQRFKQSDIQIWVGDPTKPLYAFDGDITYVQIPVRV
jgi:DNA polymerase III sliding clamp (beta) subunit (PCNA family)